MRDSLTKRPISNLQAVIDRTASAVQSTAYGGKYVDDRGPGAYPSALLLAIVALVVLFVAAVVRAIFSRER